MSCNLIFMGTGPFALAALEGLYENLAADAKLFVYTKEAKKAGRGMKEKEGCVALFAKEKGIPLYQPRTLREKEAQMAFSALEPTLAVVASYGLILPKEILSAPTYGCVNIHASLLPRYRGAAPINRAILNEETITGVTIMQMDEGLDTGDMLLKQEVVIEKNETAGDLFEKLARLGRDMILAILPDLLAGKTTPIPQDHSLSTYAEKITKEDQNLSFFEESHKILARIRGLSPMPGALCRTAKDGKILKIYSAEEVDYQGEEHCGQILTVKPRVLIKTKDGAIAPGIVQPEGKGKMTALDAVNGRRLCQGELLL